MLEAAAHLQFQDVLDFCAQYIRDRLTIDNCLEFFNMAEMYQLAYCQRDIKEFILHNFVAVAQNESFLEIAFDLLCEFLSDDRLKAESELEVFQVCITFVNYWDMISTYFLGSRILKFRLFLFLAWYRHLGKYDSFQQVEAYKSVRDFKRDRFLAFIPSLIFIMDTTSSCSLHVYQHIWKVILKSTIV